MHLKPSSPEEGEKAIMSGEVSTAYENRSRWTGGCRLAPTGHPRACWPGGAAKCPACPGSRLSFQHSQEQLPSPLICSGPFGWLHMGVLRGDSRTMVGRVCFLHLSPSAQSLPHPWSPYQALMGRSSPA